MEKQQVMQYIFLNTQKTLKEVRKRAYFLPRRPPPEEMTARRKAGVSFPIIKPKHGKEI